MACGPYGRATRSVAPAIFYLNKASTADLVGGPSS